VRSRAVRPQLRDCLGCCDLLVSSRNTKNVQSETRTTTVWISRDSAFD
jgi:hypothetical protein